MKIYQVEELVGITKKNIRFYEDEGLLNPERNPENGYRDYTLKDVRQLEKIKLLRKLSLPIEDIRLLQKGTVSFTESMNRQIERLEKEAKNAELMKDLCQRLKDENLDFNQTDAAKYLSEIQQLEKGGSRFMNIEKEDIGRKKKKGAMIAGTVFCIFLFLAFCGVIFIIREGRESLLPMLIILGIIICAFTGTVIVLIQRIKEINKGEEYAARNY